MRMRLDRARPLREKANEWPRPTSQTFLTPEALSHAVEHLIPVHRRHVVLSLSHDEYRRVPGGVQNCLGDEQRAFNGAGWTYLHLCPAVPLPMMSEEIDPARFAFNITIDGERVGQGWAKDLIRILGDRRSCTQFTPHLVIHHMLGHSPEIVVALLEALKIRDTTFWVHDFFSLCPNYTLLRNDVKFCNAPPIDSPACGVCVYGQERREHVARLARLFATLPRIVAPSRAARDFWCASSGYTHNDLVVLPHCSFVPEATRKREVTRDGPLTIAFIGVAVPHKGWDTFVELAQRSAPSGEYRFLHLGMPGCATAEIAHVEVLVSPDDRTAMIRTLQEQDVDVVVNWSLCYETFSFTTLEAIAAGAFIVARRSSGNIAALIANTNQGCLLEDEAELFNLFGTGQLRTLVEKTFTSEIQIGTIRSHGITADILLEDATDDCHPLLYKRVIQLPRARQSPGRISSSVPS
jgi:glycosyltransferase involved in cell wall biosynthesis